MTGYVTKADAAEDGETVRLKIPNREISSIFEDAVVRLFRETLGTNMQKSMMEAFWNGDAKEADMEKDLDEAMDQIVTGKYAEGLYGYGQILCYGIVFFQKQARVKLLKQEG